MLGLIEARVGPCAVKLRELLTAPAASLTLTLLLVTAASSETVNVAVTVVEFTTATLVTATPLPETETPVAVSKFVPVRLTVKLVPRMAAFGEIELRTGLRTVNCTLLLLTPDRATVTFFVPAKIPAPMVTVAVMVVSLTTAILLTLMLAAPGFSAVTPVRLLPVRVTLAIVRANPDEGVIVLSTGAVGVTRVKATPLLMAPPEFATITVLLPAIVVERRVKVAVTVASLITFRLLTLINGRNTGQVAPRKRHVNNRTGRAGIRGDGR